MSTIGFECGCRVTTSMFGKREVLSLSHCWQHWHLYSQDKAPRQMAEEIMAAEDHTWKPEPVREHPEGLYA